MKPSELLRQMLSKYASCNSYHDYGAVVGETYSIKFATFFARPDKFRIEWFDGISDPEVLCSDGHRTFHVARNQIFDFPSLSHALQSVAGISMGAADSLLPLLSPDIDKGARTGLYSTLAFDSVDQSSLFDIQCFHVQAELTEDQPVDIWIGCDDLSIRRLRSTVAISSERYLRAIDRLAKKYPGDQVYDRLRQKASTKSVKFSHSDYCYQQVQFELQIPDKLFSSTNPSESINWTE